MLHLSSEKEILNPLTHNWLILKRLCFKFLTNKTLEIRGKSGVPTLLMLPFPMIYPLELSPKVTEPLFVSDV